MATSWFLLFLLSWLVACCLSNGLSILLILVHSPIEDVVVLEGFTNEQITEDLSEVGVVRLVVETEGTGVVEIDGELVRESSAENLSWSGHLLLHDTVVLLLLSSSLETLPWERATAEVEHDIAERLHVIAARLFNAQVSVDGGITGRSSQVLVLTIWDVKMSLGVPVFLCQTKIDDIDLIASLANTHEEVVRLDITVDKGFGMDVLDSRDELVGQQEDGLEGELAVAEVEQIFQAGAEEVKNHGVVVTFCAEPADERNADTTGKRLVDTGLVLELRVFSLDRFEFDSNLFTRDDVGAQVNVTETATTDLSSNAVLVTDTQILSTNH